MLLTAKQYTPKPAPLPKPCDTIPTKSPCTC